MSRREEPIIRSIDDLLPVVKNKDGEEFLKSLRGILSASLYLNETEYHKYREQVLIPLSKKFKGLPEDDDQEGWAALKKLTKEIKQ